MDHPKSEGVLFVNKDRKKDSHPNFRGHIEVTNAQIKRLIQMAKNGQEPKLQVASWKRKSKAGEHYMYMQTEAYMKLVEADDDFGEEDVPEDDPFEMDDDTPADDNGFGDDDFDDDDIPF
jgi:hypothetical protein